MKEVHVSEAVYATMSFFSAFGILEAIGLLIFNMVHRSKR